MADEHRAVADLVHRYAELIDAGDFDGVADLLADAEVTTEGVERARRGREEILAMYVGSTRLYGDGTPRTKHLATNLIVEVAGDGATATARSYFTVLQAVPGALALKPIIAGRYRDRFDRTADGWRFAARHIVIELAGDLSHHLLFDLPDPAG